MPLSVAQVAAAMCDRMPLVTLPEVAWVSSSCQPDWICNSPTRLVDLVSLATAEAADILFSST